MMIQIIYSKGSLKAKEVLDDCGFEHLLDFPLELFASGLGATVVEKPLINSDGRIIFGKKHTLIEINQDIPFETRKRFTIAHELGHYILHPGLELHNDNESTTSWFNSKEMQAKNGKVEYEANQFASELLVPSQLFYEEQKNKKFSPDLLRSLADKFKVSITAIAFKYFELGSHPICLIHCHNNRVTYWKRPPDYPHFIKNLNKLRPPEDSVAAEYYEKGKIYPEKYSKQEIWKSTWFELKDWENDNDFDFYEYCVVSKHYNMTLSIVWEE